MPDEANPNAAVYAREEERRTKLKAWLEAGAARATPAVAPRSVGDEAPVMSQLENDLAVCVATGVEVPPPPDPPVTQAAARAPTAPTRT
jgi:hypothetical protein